MSGWGPEPWHCEECGATGVSNGVPDECRECGSSGSCFPTTPERPAPAPEADDED